MKIFRVMLASLFAWLAGLCSILTLSYFKYETPGIQDAIGFGGLLLFACIVLIPLLYIPTLLLLRRSKLSVSKLFLPLSLIFIANIPVYFILWKLHKTQMGSGEGFLFFVGFIVIGCVFGLSYPFTKIKYRHHETL